MVTFIKMVITRVKNRSPDMTPTAFDGKFDEKKDEIPPGICRSHMLQNIQYWEFEGTQMVITRVPGSPPWPEFGIYLATIPTKVFSCPKGSILIKYSSF